MDEIAKELQQIRQEIESVKNNLDLSNGSTELLKGAMAKIQNSLQTEASGSGSIGDALREAAGLYDRTDKMLAGITIEDNRSLFEQTGDLLLRIRDWIRRILELFGLVTGGSNEDSAYVGDPVNVCTGNYVSDIQELRFSGQPTLSFVRHYNSLYLKKGPMGPGWTHNYEISLQQGDGTLDLIMGDQWCERFIRAEEGIYISSYNRYSCISTQPTGEKEKEYLYIHENGTIYRFDAACRISRVGLRNGREISFHYENGSLARARDTSGRSLFYSYDDKGSLIRVKDHTGRSISMEYSDGRLVRVVSADGREKNYTYDEAWRLQSISDNTGTMVIWNEYDEENRVILQRLPNDTTMSYAYEGDKITVTDRNGAVTTYRHNEYGQITDIIRSDGTRSFVYDENRQRTGVILPDGAEFRKEYDEEGNPVGLIDPLKNRIEIRYAGSGLPSQITEKDGGINRMEYDEYRNVIFFEDAAGEATHFEYERGLLARIVYPDHSEITFQRDEKGNIICRTDEEGRSTCFTYDEAGRVTRRNDPGDLAWEYTYDPCDRLLSIKNPAGAEKTFGYSETGRIASVRDYDGTLRQWYYNELDLVSSYVNQNGLLAAYTYDENGNLTEIRLPNGGRILHTYDGYNRRISTVDELGLETIYTYDANDRLISERQGEAVRSMEYDLCGRLIKTTEKNGGISCVDRDAMGRVRRLTRADGSVFSYVYDRKGRCTKRTDAAGAVTEYLYDSRDRLTEIQENGVTLQCYTRYADGRVRTVQKADGSSLIYTYDEAGNLIRIETGTGYVVEYGYDSLHRPTSMRDSMGRSASCTYDAAGRLKEFINGKGDIDRYAYSASGKLISVEDAAGGSTWYEYDEMDRLRGVFAGEGENARNMSFVRNAKGQLTGILNAEGDADRYTYDEYGRMILHESPGKLQTRYSYDVSGNVSGILYADGRSVRMDYDLLGRMTGLEDWNGRMEIDYDAMGHATCVRDTSGNEIYYRWDDTGHRTCMQYPDGKQVFFEHNVGGQTAEIRTEAGIIRYSYDEFGRLAAKKTDWGGSEYAYEPDGRIRQITYFDREGKYLTLTLEYDACGNVTGRKLIRNRDKETLCTSYIYDVLGRITEIRENDVPIRAYLYDACGNRIQEKSAGFEINSQYNRLNQLVCQTVTKKRMDVGKQAVTDGQKEETAQEKILWTYNRDGQVVTRQGSDSSYTIHYDSAGKPAEITNSDGNCTTYIYDGLGMLCGRQTVRKGKTSHEHYAYDFTQPHMPMVFCADDEKKSGFIQDGEITGELLDKELRHYACDQQGSVLRYLSGEGISLQEYSYDEFGRDLSGNAGRMQKFGYTGLAFHAELEGWQTSARIYSPQIGRFLQKDRERYIHIGEPQSANLYTYCLNNPLLYVDPDGTDCYIFYLPEWRDEALNDQQRLAEQYGYGTDQVHLVPVTNRRELTDGWNEMGTVNGNRVDIDTVVINTHADPRELGFGNGNRFTRRNAMALDEKEMENLILYGCNAGHLDYQQDNIAAAFSRRTNGAPVMASDGTVYGMNSDETYRPEADDAFRSWADRAGNGDRGNEGWQIYRQVDGQTVVTSTGMYAATVVAMLDTLRSMAVKENAE